MIPVIRIQDIADILIMTFLLYQLYSWFRGTRAIQILLGLGVITLIFFATRFLDLYMTSWVLQELGTVLILLIIVVFQAEIRQALYRFSLFRYALDSHKDIQTGQFQEIAETVFRLATAKTGALIVFQGNESLRDLVSNGVSIDSEISVQMLESIFYNGAPFHDGAAVIANGRIEKAACHLPLSVSTGIPHHLGTRHRAALGLSERSDAIVLVVSEERGEVSLVVGGAINTISSPSELMAKLEVLIVPTNEQTHTTFIKRIFADIFPKACLLLGVTVFWVLVTTRQGQITSVTVPVRIHGVPDKVVLMRTIPEEVTVQVKALSSLAPAPAKLELTAEVDASKIIDGTNVININNTNITVPSGIAVTTTQPAQIRIIAETKLQKNLPVKAVFKESLSTGIKAVCEPSSVKIEGPASQVAPLSIIETERITAHTVKKGDSFNVKLRSSGKNVQPLSDNPITVKILSTSRNNR